MNKRIEEIDFEVIKKIDNVFLVRYTEKIGVIVFTSDKEIIPNFKYILIDYFITKDNKDAILIYSDQEKIVRTIFELVSCGCKPIEALLLLKNNLEINSADVLKFYGDLGEAIFILENDGVKIFEGESADVRVKNDLFEVKTFSCQKMTIKINYKELKANSTKVAIEIILDETGMTIIEIADKIKDSIYSSYLKKTYLSSEFSKIKYKLSQSFQLTNLPIIKLPQEIIKAEFDILIRDPQKN